MDQRHEYTVRVETAGPACAMHTQAAEAGTGMIDTADVDRVSIEWHPIGAATSAELEVRKSYGNVRGESQAFSTAATFTNGARRRLELDVQDCPMLEVIITTAGGAGAMGILHVYGYSTV